MPKIHCCLNLIIFSSTVGLVSLLHRKIIVVTAAHTLCSIVVIIQTTAQQEARKEAPPREVIKIAERRAWPLFTGDIGRAKSEGTDKDGAQHSLKEERRLARVNLHKDDNQGEEGANGTQSDTQLGTTAKLVTDKGIHAIVLKDVGGRTHDNNGRGHVSRPNRETRAPRLEFALDVNLKRASQIAREEGDGTDESRPAEVVQVSVRHGSLFVDRESMPTVGHDGNQSRPKGSQHEAKQALYLSTNDEERRNRIEVHKDNNSAKGERAGGTDNGPLLVRLRLGIAALSIVVGLSSSV